MNKPAPKEPSMDEILSSIRQIIADDDAGAAVKKAPIPMPAAAVAAPPRSFMPQPVAAPPEPEPEPFALSAEQILRDTAAEDNAKPGLSFSELVGSETSAFDSAMVDPEDITFETEEEDEPPFTPPAPPPRAVVDRPAPRPVAVAAPLPDPQLTADLAEELLEPTTQSAVQSTFARLSNVQTVGSGVTIEEMMREMLRPMLKEWLDENLPSVVERMVEREIARVSRGVK
jgi:cell pole-organizing protein PopZ